MKRIYGGTLLIVASFLTLLGVVGSQANKISELKAELGDQPGYPAPTAQPSPGCRAIGPQTQPAVWAEGVGSASVRATAPEWEFRLSDGTLIVCTASEGGR